MYLESKTREDNEMGCDDWKWDREPVKEPSTKTHSFAKVYKDAWAPGYGDTSQPTKEPWAVCSCGFETNLYGNHDNRFELVRINHLLIAIAKEVGVIIA